MKILICTAYHYYNDPATEEQAFGPFTQIPKEMGHEVHFLDHVWYVATGKEMFNNFFRSVVKNGHYDLVFIQMTQDEFLPEVLDECKRYTCLVSWNSDDDWRWENYSRNWYPHFNFMFTTYRHIYEANRQKFPNLLLSQWACSGFFDGRGISKNIDFSFVGLTYGDRAKNIAYINKRIPLKTFGRNTRATSLPWKQKIKRAGARLLRIPFENNTLTGPEAVNEIWNRSRVCYTPLLASRGGRFQIKARVFEMGLSGAVMLCDRHPDLHEFYEPGKEYVEFEDNDDCIVKAKFLLSHENERRKIAQAYYVRTRKEHLWRHRFEKIFEETGLSVK